MSRNKQRSGSDRPSTVLGECRGAIRAQHERNESGDARRALGGASARASGSSGLSLNSPRVAGRPRDDTDRLHQDTPVDSTRARPGDNRLFDELASVELDGRGELEARVRHRRRRAGGHRVLARHLSPRPFSQQLFDARIRCIVSSLNSSKRTQGLKMLRRIEVGALTGAELVALVVTPDEDCLNQRSRSMQTTYHHGRSERHAARRHCRGRQ